MTRYLISGASGLLGLNFALYLAKNASNRVYGTVGQNSLYGVPFDVLGCDLVKPGEVKRLMDIAQPEVVIHCAALANIDACESQPELTRRVNAEVPGEFAAECRSAGVQMVQISTDSIYDGVKGNFSETDPVNPLSAYSRSKLAGEEAVASANEQAIIARVVFYGWSLRGQRSLAEWFFNNLSAGKTTNGFTDVFTCPLMVDELVDLLVKMLRRQLKGVYNVVSSESLSKCEFGRRIARCFGFDENLIRPVSWVDGGLKAVRSPNLTVNVEKLTRDLGEAPPGQGQGLERFYHQYLEHYPQRLHAYAEKTP